MAGDLIDGQQQTGAGNVPAGYVVDQSSLTANPHGEGTYKMVGPQGQTVQVPFSKVRAAEDMRYQVVPDDLKRYTKDAVATQPGLTDRLAAWGQKTFPHITAAEVQKQWTTPNDIAPSGEPPHPHQPWLDSSDDGPSNSGPYAYDIKPIMAPIDEFGENVVNNLGRFVTALPAAGMHGLDHLLSPSQWEILDADSWTPAGYQRKKQKELEAALASGQARVLASGEAPPKPTAEMWSDYAAEQAANFIKAWAGGKALGPALGWAADGLGFEQAESAGLRDAARDVMGGSGTPAASTGTAFSVPFLQIMDSLDASELDRRAPGGQRALVQKIFQDSPNLPFATDHGPNRVMSPGDFFSLDRQTRNELKGSVIDVTTEEPLGKQLGVGMFQQGVDGDGLAKPPHETAEDGSQPAVTRDLQAEAEDSSREDGVGAGISDTLATITPAKNAPLTEDSSQPDAGMGAAVANTTATTTPATPVQTAPETAATPDGQTVTEALPQNEGITTSVETDTKKVAGGLATIRGRKPINSRYAGGWHPEGIEFSEQGFPKFGPHAIVEVQVEGLTGDYDKDSAKANRVLDIPSTPDGYTWHDVEDGKTMQLIPSGIHRKVRHTGGAAVIRNGGLDKK